MVTKFFKEFSGNKAAFIEAGHPATYADNIVFIKDEANKGAGACIFARGSYFGNFAELIAALAYVKGVKLGSDSYVAAKGGGFIEFVASNPSQLSLNVTEGKLTIGLTESFVKSVNDVIAEVSAIKADYLKASDKEELSQLVNDKDAAMKQYVDAEIAKVASSETFTELEGRVKAIEDDYLKNADKEALQGAINTEKGRIDTLENTTIPALGQRITNEAPVTMETAAGEGEILNVYTFKQNGKTIGTINTRKELVVTGGEIVEKEGVKYLSLSIANQDTPVEIPVSELVDVYTAGDYVTIGADNEISVDKAAIIEGLATDANAQQYAANAKSEAIAHTDDALKGYYNKSEVDGLVSPKADKTYVDAELAKKANQSDMETALNGKANVGDSYLKAETYTQAEVDAMFAWEKIG